MPWKVEWDKNSGRLEIDQVKNTINCENWNSYQMKIQQILVSIQELPRTLWTFMEICLNWYSKSNKLFLRNTADINQIIWSRYKESWYKNINIKMNLKIPQQGKTIKISLKLKILHLLWARSSLTFSQL